eukprot:TRINITY_DN2534_c0_g1_i1.p1 TRINITY_DN2534_c0_g1~~TRINITY_DN2534_c0_g1_i1.p1  ORF type:complete len:389 (-),score=88.92 TRINITY_DN2534_c0_g1_i1:31-1197(-)
MHKLHYISNFVLGNEPEDGPTGGEADSSPSHYMERPPSPSPHQTIEILSRQLREATATALQEKRKHQDEVENLTHQIEWYKRRIAEAQEGAGVAATVAGERNEIAERLTQQIRDLQAAEVLLRRTNQEEVQSLTQQVERYKRKVNELHDENSKLRERQEPLERRIELLENKLEQQKAECAMDAQRTAHLEEALTAKDTELRAQSVALTNLQRVLDGFSEEHASELSRERQDGDRRVAAVTLLVRAKEDELRSKDEDRATLIEAHERELQRKDKIIQGLESKVLHLLEAMEAHSRRIQDEATVDKALVNHLFLKYWLNKNSPTGAEVLRLMAKILNWDDEMQAKTGLKTARRGLWQTLLQPAVDEPTPEQKISDLWLDFLEKQAASSEK